MKKEKVSNQQTFSDALTQELVKLNLPQLKQVVTELNQIIEALERKEAIAAALTAHRFMVGKFQDTSFIAERYPDGTYHCIPRYSGGNRTDMTFYCIKAEARFYLTLEDAIARHNGFKRMEQAQREEDYLTGKTDRHGNPRREY
jgi:hypothetical protein